MEIGGEVDRKYVTDDAYSHLTHDIPTTGRSTRPASTRGKAMSKREGLDRVLSFYTRFNLCSSRVGRFYTAPLLPKLCPKSVKCGGHCWFCTNIMPQDRYSSQDAFNINLLDSQALDTPDGLRTALRAIEEACYRGDPEIATMVVALNSRSHILEYIITGMSCAQSSYELPVPIFCPLVLEEGAYEKLSKWIVTGFPTSATPGMVGTVSMQLLRRLSSSLLFAEYSSAADVPPDLRVFWRKVELSFDVLKNLEENVTSTLTGGNVSPVSRRKGKAVTNSRRIDPLPFDSMGITVPTTDAEVRDVYVTVLSQLRSILEVCGFMADSLRVELNNPSTISSFSGSRCYRRFSNPLTSRRTYHRNKCPLRQRKRRS